MYLFQLGVEGVVVLKLPCQLPGLSTFYVLLPGEGASPVSVGRELIPQS